ncbi:MAG: hypothetical protein EAZ43_02400 [Betaproteobacteria bacterium]|nr:MAG: hypothetical protein EAZ43_02400 [Betaproteobacteria bacterium]
MFISAAAVAAPAVFSIGSRAVPYAQRAVAVAMNPITTLSNSPVVVNAVEAVAGLVLGEAPGRIAPAIKSPDIQCYDLIGKSTTEIRQLASDKGLVPHATRPDKWMDPATGKRRLRLDKGRIDAETKLPYTDPKAAKPHHHEYESNGKTKIVDPTDGNPHFPTSP